MPSLWNWSGSELAGVEVLDMGLDLVVFSKQEGQVLGRFLYRTGLSVKVGEVWEQQDWECKEGKAMDPGHGNVEVHYTG